MRKTKKDFKTTLEMLEYSRDYKIPIKLGDTHKGYGYVLRVIPEDNTIGLSTDNIFGYDDNISTTNYDLDWETFDKWNSDFSDAKVGDEVWDRGRESRITEIIKGNKEIIIYPIRARALGSFSDASFTIDGKLHTEDNEPLLFKTNPNIFNEKGKEMIVEEKKKYLKKNIGEKINIDIRYEEEKIITPIGVGNYKVLYRDEYGCEKMADLSNIEIIKEKTYRPFASAKEFEPHRDRWIKHKTISPDRLIRVLSYGNVGAEFQEYSFRCYETLFHEYVFEDGTPCGVEV